MHISGELSYSETLNRGKDYIEAGIIKKCKLNADDCKKIHYYEWPNLKKVDFGSINTK